LANVSVLEVSNWRFNTEGQQETPMIASRSIHFEVPFRRFLNHVRIKGWRLTVQCGIYHTDIILYWDGWTSNVILVMVYEIEQSQSTTAQDMDGFCGLIGTPFWVAIAIFNLPHRGWWFMNCSEDFPVRTVAFKPGVSLCLWDVSAKKTLLTYHPRHKMMETTCSPHGEMIFPLKIVKQ